MKTRLHILATSCLTGVLLLLPCVTLHAQDLSEEPSFEALDETTQQRIGELLDLIQSAEEQERYDSALSYLDEAQQLFDHPEFWLDRARILEAMGRHQEAAGWIKRFTQVRPDSPRTTTLGRRAMALANTPDRPDGVSASGSLRITSSPSGAKVSFRDHHAPLKGSTPTISIPVPKPRTFRVIVSKPGYLSQERDIHVKPGQQRALNVTLEKDPSASIWQPPEVDARAPIEQSRGSGPWLLWGVGAAGIAGMILTTRHGETLDARASRGEDVSRERARTRGLFVASTVTACAAVVGGTILWFARSPEQERAAGLVLSAHRASVHVEF